jgi:hypothetical protein
MSNPHLVEPQNVELLLQVEGIFRPIMHATVLLDSEHPMLQWNLPLLVALARTYGGAKALPDGLFGELKIPSFQDQQELQFEVRDEEGQVFLRNLSDLDPVCAGLCSRLFSSTLGIGS